MNDLIRQLSELTGLLQDQLWHAMLVFLRVGGAVSMLPALGEQIVPVRIRIALAVGITLVAAPAITPMAAGMQIGFGTILIEMVTGLCLGFGLRSLIHGLQTAGTIAAQSTSLAQIFAGPAAEPQPAMSNLLVMAALALFVATGGVWKAVALVILSYEVLPQGSLPGGSDMAQWGLSQVVRSTALALSLAAPFILGAFLYNVAIGVANRFMPQLMLSFVGTPVLTLGSLALLALCSPFLLSMWQEAMTTSLAHPFGG